MPGFVALNCPRPVDEKFFDLTGVSRSAQGRKKGMPVAHIRTCAWAPDGVPQATRTLVRPGRELKQRSR